MEINIFSAALEGWKKQFFFFMLHGSRQFWFVFLKADLFELDDVEGTQKEKNKTKQKMVAHPKSRWWKIWVFHIVTVEKKNKAVWLLSGETVEEKKEVGVLDAVGAMALLMEILLDFVYVTL